MSALWIALLCSGGVFLVLCIGFLFPAVIVGKLSAETKGVIREITRDALKYNERIAASAKNRNKTKGVYIRAGVGSTRGMGDHTPVMYHMVYAYAVDGVEYSRADGPGYNKGLAEKKIGKEVTVYYDPENPLKASLSSGEIYRGLSILFFFMGVLSVAAGIMMISG
ncbi:MAG: DUF3592 domain-containing protein [Lachnospiraceae bacterium]|nr:DUF3592 domain-containing protein [Lachnospiraceae bacterium]